MQIKFDDLEIKPNMSLQSNMVRKVKSAKFS